MKRKNIISLTISLAFLSLSTTGLLLYFGLKPEAVTTIHVLMGLLFTGFAVFHIKNNWGSLTAYSKERKEGKIKKEFFIAAALVAVFLIGAGFNLPPFPQIQHAGEDLTRGEKKGGFFDKTTFTNIETNKDKAGFKLNFIVEKSNGVITPVIAMWVEDTSGNFVENLFVPAKTIEVTSGEEDKRRALFEGETETKTFTPSLLPNWQTKTKDTAANYNDATPTDNFFLATKTKATGKFQVMLEARDGNKAELYKATIDQSKGDIFTLKSKTSSLLVRAIVQINFF